jgi:hypothetical protein
MSYEHVIRMFLDEQPHWLAHDVQYRQLEAGAEPEMALSTTAMKAFVEWSMHKGLVGKPERVPDFLDLMDRLPQIHAAHDAGLCYPETCPICQAELGPIDGASVPR